MIIDFAVLGTIKEQPVLVLCNADDTAIQTLGFTFNLKADICYNEVSTITFDIPAYVNGEPTPHYNDITGMRIIDMVGWGKFILINPTVSNNGIREVKSCKAYSLEYELTFKKTYFDEGTYNFWNPLSPENTVLGLLISDLPSWTVGTVDTALIGKYRTFSEDNANIYNFIKSTVQKTYGCIFDFNTYNRKINVYSVESDATTKPVYISLDNLAKEIDIDEDTENIFTVLDVNGGDGVDIRAVNPLGTNKIYNLDYFMNTSNFDQAMIDKWNTWKSIYKANQLSFYNVSVEKVLKTSAILAEQAALSTLTDIELPSLENQRSVYIEYLAQLSDRSSAEYVTYQAKLDSINSDIASMKSQIDEQNNIIETLISEKEELTSQLLQIQNDVSFDSFFNNDELIKLNRYFKEESIEDSSFVTQNVESYSGANISNSINNIAVSFSGGVVTKVLGMDNKDLYTVLGGTMTCGFTANLISASFERNITDGSFVLSAFLSNGSISDTDFPSGCVSVTGSCTTINADVSEDSEISAYLVGSVLSTNIISGKLFFTRDATEYEKYSVAWDLYKYGESCLNALAYPTYSFKVSAANFFAIDAFSSFVARLSLGQKVYLNIGNQDVLQPIFIGVEISFEDMSSMSLSFSDKYSSSDNAFKLVDLLDKSVSMGKTVDANKLNYSAFIDSGASTQVKKFMDSALDVAKNAILSSTGQGIAWDDSGLHLRKYLNSENTDAGYEDEQIWMINNSIVFTDDGWQTAKMAIGKIIDENIAKYPETADQVFNESKTYYYKNKDSEYCVWEGNEDTWNTRPTLYEKNATAYGIVAPYIVGTILAGQNLIITTEDGSFRVDSSGVHVDSLKFYISHGGSAYDTTLEDELSSLEDATTDLSLNLAEAVSSINGRIDGTVTTYYQNDIPEQANMGDLWFDTDGKKLFRHNPDNYVETEDVSFVNGKQYFYKGEDNLYYEWHGGQSEWSERPTLYELVVWELIEDSGITDAIAAASQAQETADGKVTTYYQNYAPHEPSYGDIWYNNATDSIVYRRLLVGDNLSGVELHFDVSVLPPSAEIAKVVETESGTYLGSSGVLGTVIFYAYTNTSTILYTTTDGWVSGLYTCSSNAGKITAINQESPFYSAITGKFTNVYTSNKFYRYNGSVWQMLEDGDIGSIKTDVSNINKTLGDFITEEGYLTASKLKGAISTALTTMKNGTGNVLFDDDGIWLMNSTQKSTSTKAIWMNENGILFGNGNKTDDPAEDWDWTTAIGHDGITADALASKTLSAVTINGGSISIGDGMFTVDNSGNLTAKSGTFKGTLDAPTLKGILSADDNDTWLTGCGINVGNGNFYVDTSGNVTMKGSINMSNGSITWNSNNSPVKVQYSVNGSSNWHTTYASTDYYARYSYDGGTTWTSAIRIQGTNGLNGTNGRDGTDGRDGADGSDGSDANVTFRNVNSALGNLWRSASGGTTSSVAAGYMYAPDVMGGNFYGSTFYAGIGDGYSVMEGSGFSVVDPSGNRKIGLGYYSSAYTYPYLTLGVGSGSYMADAGMVMKFGSGVWIGTSNVMSYGGSRPPTGDSSTTGIFVDFDNETIYKYLAGVRSDIGSGGTSGGTATAVFGY